MELKREGRDGFNRDGKGNPNPPSFSRKRESRSFCKDIGPAPPSLDPRVRGHDDGEGQLLFLAGTLLAWQAPSLATLGRVIVMSVAVVLAAVALRSAGRTPFRAVVVLALVDVAVLVVAR